MGTGQHLNAQGKRLGRVKAALLVLLRVEAVEWSRSSSRARRRQSVGSTVQLHQTYLVRTGRGFPEKAERGELESFLSAS